MKLFKGNLKVEKIIQETPNAKTFLFKKQLDFKPGQFITLSKQTNGEKIKRSFSIASPPTKNDFIHITIKKEENGAMSSYFVDDVKVGDEFEVMGPMGLFTYEDNLKDIVLIGGGSGITPLMSILRYIIDKKLDVKITLFYSNKKPEYIIYRKELEELSKKYPQFKYIQIVTKDPAWKGHKERFNKHLLKQYVSDLNIPTYYVSGPTVMVKSIKELLLNLNINKSNIKTEEFG